jgi:hypothetical protein
VNKPQNNRAVPPRIASGRWWPAPLVLALGVLIATGLALLFLFDPARHAFYPACLFKKMTGYDCPGCGGLRAVHHLLRGDVPGALRLNALAVIAIPLFGVWMLRAGWRRVRHGDPGRPSAVFWVCLGAVALVLFGLMRNLPFWPFGVTPM